MIYGVLSGITWAIETIILGIALAMTPFLDGKQAIMLAPFVSTFLHDACSALWATLFNVVKGNEKNVIKALKTKSGKFVALAAIIGGPIGMTGYVLTVKYMGSSIGAIASAIYPAIGAILAFIFLKEKMQWYRWIMLIITLAGVYGLSYSPDIQVTNFMLGLLGTFMCSFGWGVEAVVLAKCMQDDSVKDEYALQIRQSASALFYGVVILPIIGGWKFTISLFSANSMSLIGTIALAALFATISYLFYYKAIATIGASKAMAINVSYVAWAIIFNIIFFHETSLLSPMTLLCAVIVIVCGIFAAADFKEIFNRATN